MRPPEQVVGPAGTEADVELRTLSLRPIGRGPHAETGRFVGLPIKVQQAQVGFVDGMRAIKFDRP